RITWRKVGDPKADPTVIETILTPERAIIGPEGPGAQELYGTRRTAFERQLNRLPWSILRARVRPEAGLLVIRTGGGKLGPYDCDYVVTWFEGNATHLAIDKATGRMVQMGSMGRDTQSRVMSLTMDALGDAGPQALRLPTQWVTYPTGEKEGTKGPELTIVTGPATAPATAPAAAAPVNVPAGPRADGPGASVEVRDVLPCVVRAHDRDVRRERAPLGDAALHDGVGIDLRLAAVPLHAPGREVGTDGARGVEHVALAQRRVAGAELAGPDEAGVGVGGRCLDDARGFDRRETLALVVLEVGVAAGERTEGDESRDGREDVGAHAASVGTRSRRGSAHGIVAKARRELVHEFAERTPRGV
ncbi:MAG: hypothetical protein EBU70_15305, partial [Actinobacteria bacterium]|nr:hypothetical protein [Actinomycetota bacterium]